MVPKFFAPFFPAAKTEADGCDDDEEEEEGSGERTIDCDKARAGMES